MCGDFHLPQGSVGAHMSTAVGRLMVEIRADRPAAGCRHEPSAGRCRAVVSAVERGRLEVVEATGPGGCARRSGDVAPVLVDRIARLAGVTRVRQAVLEAKSRCRRFDYDAVRGQKGFLAQIRRLKH
jgi:hypothetical protein